MTQGSIVALVTPMLASGEIDGESLEALVEWHVSSGTVGIVLVGTTASCRRLVLKRTARLFVLSLRKRKVE